jgi:choline dehydrogenase-like flavoprotein
VKTYDVIVVGGGAAGGIVAGVLAEAGRHVLLLERGRALAFKEIPRDHLRNHRLALYGHNTGPELEGNPRVWVDSRGSPHVVRPNEGGYQNNAMTLGGGSRVYGAQAWRFLEQDFRMASTYGVPAGSSLADWPIAYDDLEPYYERAEWEVGVAGSDDGNRFQAPRRTGYPMPPVPPTVAGDVLVGGANALGWNTFPAPIAINTVPYLGRAACVQCQHCVGFADGRAGQRRRRRLRHRAGRDAAARLGAREGRRRLLRGHRIGAAPAQLRERPPPERTRQRP